MFNSLKSNLSTCHNQFISYAVFFALYCQNIHTNWQFLQVDYILPALAMHILCVNHQAHAVGESDDGIVEAFGEGVVDCHPCVCGVRVDFQRQSHGSTNVVFGISRLANTSAVGGY